MNKDQIKGRVKEVAGNIKKNLATNDEDRSEGALKETEGTVQKGFGDLKNKIGNAIDK